jgi:S-adenosylmethionine hydrolase
VIDLMHDAPVHDPRAAAYLLAALVPRLPAGAVMLAVVDPGVGGPRDPVIVEADGRWYVGPCNGLFELVMRRAREVRWWTIDWRPERLSASFHGRDLFAPVAARLARGEMPAANPRTGDVGRHPEWPDDLGEVIYVDGFGNCMTGLRAAGLAASAKVVVHGRGIARVGTFADVPAGEPLWYENAAGLAEIAVNRGRANELLGLLPGNRVELS